MWNKMYIPQLLGAEPYIIKLVMLTNHVYQISYILTDFLFTFSTSYLERYVKIPKHCWIFISVSFYFCQLWLHIFWKCVIEWTQIKQYFTILLSWPFYHYKCTSLYFRISLALKSILLNISIFIPDFFVLMIT